jgi:hypothetical protein
MRYNEQTGGVEIGLSELCALAFGRGNYHDEAQGVHDQSVLEGNAHEYFADVKLQHTCRYAGVLIKVTGQAQGIAKQEDGGVTLDYTVRSAKLPSDEEVFTVPVRQRCLA